MDTAWAKQWLQQFKFTELDALLQRYGDDALLVDVTFGVEAKGKAALAAFFNGFFHPDLGNYCFVLRSYRGGFSSGAVEWTWNAEHYSDFMGYPAQGKQTAVDGASVLTFRDSRIVEQHDYWDAHGLFEQLKADVEHVEPPCLPPA